MFEDEDENEKEDEDDSFPPAPSIPGIFFRVLRFPLTSRACRVTTC